MNKAMFPLLIISLIFPISSCNMMIIWVGLEINTIVFIYIMKTSMSGEGLMKYFLVQEIGSMNLIMAMIMCNYSATSEDYPSTLIGSLVSMGMLIKLGSSPFHHWMIQVGVTMKMIYLPILLSIQKTAPLFVLKPYSSTSLILSSVLMSGLVGSVSMLLINKIKTLLILSSISHLSWMMISSMNSKKSTVIYISIYTLILFNIINEVKKEYDNSQPILSESSLPLIVLLLSLGGIPPLIGFIPKLFIICSTSLSSEVTITIIMITIFSILGVISYTRIMYKLLLKATYLSKMKKMKINSSGVFFQSALMPLLMLMI